MLMCAYCNGTAVTIEMLRRFAPGVRVNDIWLQAKSTRERSERDCPSCESAMRRVTVKAGEHTVVLETCAQCHVVWFDGDELRTLSPDATEPSEEERRAAAKRLGIKDHDSVGSGVWRFVGQLGRMLSEREGVYGEGVPWSGEVF